MSDAPKAERAVQNGPRSLKPVILPAILLWAGIVLALYGAVMHEQTVLVEQEIAPPPEFAPLAPDGLPWNLPPPTPPLPEIRLVGVSEPEPALVRDVSVGGVVRLETGELKRTYTGDAPSLCPT